MKNGKWIDKGWDGDMFWQIDGRGRCWRVKECSECGYRLCGQAETKYCGGCGAKMEKDKGEKQ